jgi:hypothetical protein
VDPEDEMFQSPDWKTENALVQHMQGVSDDTTYEFWESIRECMRFEDSGILSRDRGFVIDFADGSQVQCTIVVSRRGRG